MVFSQETFIKALEGKDKTRIYPQNISSISILELKNSFLCLDEKLGIQFADQNLVHFTPFEKIIQEYLALEYDSEIFMDGKREKINFISEKKVPKSFLITDNEDKYYDCEGSLYTYFIGSNLNEISNYSAIGYFLNSVLKKYLENEDLFNKLNIPIDGIALSSRDKHKSVEFNYINFKGALPQCALSQYQGLPKQILMGSYK